MSTVAAETPTPPQNTIKKKRRVNFNYRKVSSNIAVTLTAFVVVLLWLMPLAYGVLTSLKTEEQLSDPSSPILPAGAQTIEYEGKEYDVYTVPTDAGDQSWALFKKGRESSEFIDPANLDAGPITWEGRWRTLEQARTVSPTWSNYPEAFTSISFLKLLWNTLYYALFSMVGAVGSAAIVAYGFARFQFPGRNILFIILISTIILPPQVTLVPTYAFWVYMDLVPSWWPLIIPAFFANAYNVFFLRQFFMTIPTEIEEAAMIDGAGPIRRFWNVILPQSIPALIAISLFHFFFAWNDFFNPLIYLAGARDLVPITVGLTFFNGIYGSQPELIQAASIMALILPLILFFVAQRYFVQGIVITGNK